VERLTQEITDEFRLAERGLQRMASSIQGDNSAADAKTKQNVQRCVRFRWYARRGGSLKLTWTWWTCMQSTRDAAADAVG
jgi:hypothetical protein